MVAAPSCSSKVAWMEMDLSLARLFVFVYLFICICVNVTDFVQLVKCGMVLPLLMVVMGDAGGSDGGGFCGSGGDGGGAPLVMECRIKLLPPK